MKATTTTLKTKILNLKNRLRLKSSATLCSIYQITKMGINSPHRSNFKQQPKRFRNSSHSCPIWYKSPKHPRKLNQFKQSSQDSQFIKSLKKRRCRNTISKLSKFIHLTSRPSTTKPIMSKKRQHLNFTLIRTKLALYPSITNGHPSPQKRVRHLYRQSKKVQLSLPNP